MSLKRWAVILAGGDGVRVRSLTRLIAGDERPKQFCSILGGNTLLARTRARLAPAISPERTLFVVVKTHEQFYNAELADVRPSRIVVQPTNKGTTAAIAYSLLRIAGFDENAIVAFFPTDHYYAEEARFVAAVDLAFEVAQDSAEFLILLGAEPRQAEVEYGWIEPSVSLKCRLSNSFFRVSRFWEKPSLQLAQALLTRGCLWNTFVMIGHAKTFLHLITSSVPKVMRTFEPVVRQSATDVEFQRVNRVYDALTCGDFSQHVLSACTDRLAVLRLGNVGWSDLGTPERVVAAMTLSPHRARAAGSRLT